MAKKLRKTYGEVDAPSAVALMRLTETQGKTPAANWMTTQKMDMDKFDGSQHRFTAQNL
jgi:hypothetical protein